MLQSGIAVLVGFGVVSILVVALFGLRRRRGEARARLQDIAAPPRPAGPSWLELGRKLLFGLPSLSGPLLPRAEKDRARLNSLFVRAGIFHPQAAPIFLSVKGALMLLGPAAALLALMLGQSVARCVLAGIAVSALGMMLPGLWLEWKAGRRQTRLRRALPDALDVLVLCLEGGLSLSASLQRVRVELASVHPDLTAELTIAEREMMMGLSAGEALQKLGQRVDLEELRSLSAVLLQSQRYGASVVKAIRVFADSLRTEYRQQTEERAQKAAVKILFPTLLCIFPAIFVVILGPAAFQIKALFNNLK
jgi:tight adherence protein C